MLKNSNKITNSFFNNIPTFLKNIKNIKQIHYININTKFNKENNNFNNKFINTIYKNFSRHDNITNQDIKDKWEKKHGLIGIPNMFGNQNVSTVNYFYLKSE